jgi:hypothetical protein
LKITPSERKVEIDEVADAITPGNAVANVAETVMDGGFIERSRYEWYWLNGQDIPPETGWYEVDRGDRRLRKIGRDEAAELEWHERLFLYASALSAAKENRLLALYIGDEYDDGRLSALYLCGPDVLARAVQKEVCDADSASGSQSAALK